MTAPGCIKLNENILVVIKNIVLEGLANNNMNGTILLLGDRLTLDIGSKLAGDKLTNVLDNLIRGGDLILRKDGVLVVALHVVDGKSGELLVVQVKVRSVGTKGLSINETNVKVGLDLLGKLKNLVANGISVGFFIVKVISKRKT